MDKDCINSFSIYSLSTFYPTNIHCLSGLTYVRSTDNFDPAWIVSGMPFNRIALCASRAANTARGVLYLHTFHDPELGRGSPRERASMEEK